MNSRNHLIQNTADQHIGYRPFWVRLRLITAVLLQFIVNFDSGYVMKIRNLICRKFQAIKDPPPDVTSEEEQQMSEAAMEKQFLRGVENVGD